MIHARSTPKIPERALLQGYAEGRFPMCHEDGMLYWHDPDPRAVFPLEHIGPNKRMLRAMRSTRLMITRDQAFEAVIRACSMRSETWIDERIIASYSALHHAGYAHSIEVWEGRELVGGTYGVSLGAAFFAESMFSRRPNAGKFAFHALVDHLRGHGFVLLDTQYINAFTAQLGAVEVPRAEFRRTLAQALTLQPMF